MTHADAPAPHTAIPWAAELRGALATTGAMLPFVLVYGLLAFAALGPQVVASLGLTASLCGFVAGGIVMSAVSRLALPAASPSASACLILGSAVVHWAGDPGISLAQLMGLVGCTVMLAGAVFALLGLWRAGSLVGFVPQPVLSGFLNGVAVLIVLSQAPALLGLPAEAWAAEGLAALQHAQVWPLAVGLVTAALMIGVRRFAPAWPAALLALLAASAAVAALQVLPAWPAAPLSTLGAFSPGLPLPVLPALLLDEPGRELLLREGGRVLTTALVLGLIGTLETVLNLVATDQVMRRRSDVNRALMELGLTNAVLGAFGALPVVFVRLRAISAVGAGARTWRTVVIGSVLMGSVVVAAAPLAQWLPHAVVAGLLLVLAGSLTDNWSMRLMRRASAGTLSRRNPSAPGTAPEPPDSAQPSQPELQAVTGHHLERQLAPGTSSDGQADAARAARHADRRWSLATMVAVCGATVVWGFVWAVALGVVLSATLLVRALHRSLVRSRATGAAWPSRRAYTPRQTAALARAREGVDVIELEGALFFGNVERLQREVDSLPTGLAGRRWAVLLDLRRVSALDASAATALTRMRDQLQEQGTRLLLSGVTQRNRMGWALLGNAPEGATAAAARWSLHADVDQAMEAAEREALARAGLPAGGEAVPLPQVQLFEGLPGEAVARVAALMAQRQLAAGERLFSQGERGDALYVLTEGSISLRDRVRGQRFFSVSPGMCFGETAVLDGGGRTADAVADEPSTVWRLGREDYLALCQQAPAVAAPLTLNLARHLSQRLREAAAGWRRAAA